MEKSFLASLDEKDGKIVEKTILNDSPRKIIHRTNGHRSGPITRLVSPSDVGELIKPFVFLDYFEVQPIVLVPYEMLPLPRRAAALSVQRKEVCYPVGTILKVAK